MTLSIETYSNERGGNTLYKALSHPLAAAASVALLEELCAYKRLALYDPDDIVAQVAALLPLSELAVSQIFTQRSELIGEPRLDRALQPVTALATCNIDGLLLLAFDAERQISQIRHLMATDTPLHSLDRLRIPDAWISAAKRYLTPLNFATNFAFFRDRQGLHTRLTGANYWSGYGAQAPRLCGVLFDESGYELARFDDTLGPAGAPFVVDSAVLRERFSLPPFAGQLFLHAVGIAGHDVLKYALDTYSDDRRQLSSTHDANPWPAQCYAGLPLPCANERVYLWLQNSHPRAIPANALALRAPGASECVAIAHELAPYATMALDVGLTFPHSECDQVELIAGQHVVRPRYEVENERGRRIAHLNVVRMDLKPDRNYRRYRKHLGRGYLLTAPLLPPERYTTELLVTPMSPAQRRLALKLRLLSPEGCLRAERSMGMLQPRQHTWWEVSRLVAGEAGYGHLELAYDTAQAGDIDGWFHAIFRYRDRDTGYAAETSFGCHLFNAILTYKNEPQSYAGPPPGLTTRLYARLGGADQETLCQLIYPSSGDWHARSNTYLFLIDGSGKTVAEVPLRVPLGGSHQFRIGDCFSAQERARAGPQGYLSIRDTSCRLFGYHALLQDNAAFSLDHMFGF